MKKIIISILFFIFFALLLTHPDKVIFYTLEGLTQWALKLVPTLLPFMIISSIMIYSGIDHVLINIISPILKPFFPFCSGYGLYTIFIGYLCGFPMGAKTTSQFYYSNKMTIVEANYLLSFCNNIGPSYFIGLIIPILKEYGINNLVPYLFGMYGIPLCYGIILGLYYKHKYNNKISYINEVFTPSNASEIFCKAIQENTKSIIVLGGFIAFASSLRTIIELIPVNNLCFVNPLLSIILEINSGIKAIYQTNSINFRLKVIIIMTGLSFNGISCFLQTSGLIQKSNNLSKNISIHRYFYSRIILTLISFLYYIFITKALPF